MELHVGDFVGDERFNRPEHRRAVPYADGRGVNVIVPRRLLIELLQKVRLSVTAPGLANVAAWLCQRAGRPTGASPTSGSPSVMAS